MLACKFSLDSKLDSVGQGQMEGSPDGGNGEAKSGGVVSRET